ncbi:hypothetical protein ACVW00_000604 [Marmoricola sp. URHA0025 HA25]
MISPKLAAAIVAVVAVALTGCGAREDEASGPRTLQAAVPLQNLADLPVGTADVGPGDKVRGRGSSLVVGGEVTDLAPLRVDEPVVVKGGVFFRNRTELWFTDLDHARATGYGHVESLVASPDGRRLAFLDFEHGPPDRFGTPLAMSVVYDATTGKPVVASYVGMGDVRSDDLTDLYEDGEPRILRFAGDALLVHGASGNVDYRIPLDGGAPQKLGH